MPIKLDIESIELRNFLSYGDYKTKLQIKKGGKGLGPVLILGEVDLDEKIASNGAGKSSLIAAFIWCLFGRTISNPNPGDKVVNYFADKDCYVKIRTTDGYEIVRTRNIDGHSELTLTKDGDATGTHSTTKNTQRVLEDLFGLDYEIFVSSVFCGQLGKSFLEMSVVKRKEALERILGLHKLNDYADKAKLKTKEVEGEQSAVRSQIDHSKIGMQRSKESLQDLVNSQEEYEKKRVVKIEELDDTLAELYEHRSVIGGPPELKVLEHKWLTVQAIQTKLESIQDQIESNERKIEIYEEAIERDRNRLDDEPLDEPDVEAIKEEHERAKKIDSNRDKIDNKLWEFKHQLDKVTRSIRSSKDTICSWEAKGDSRCYDCDQVVTQGHVESKIGGLREEVKGLEKEANALYAKIDKLRVWLNKNPSITPSMTFEQAQKILDFNAKLKDNQNQISAEIEKREVAIVEMAAENKKKALVIGKIRAQLENAMPDITLEEARRAKSEFDDCERKICSLEARKKEIKQEENPYIDVIAKVEKQLEDREQELKDLDETIAHLDILFSHYNYIYRSYSDRRKIKKWLLSELIPYLNSRIHYYLESFDIDITIAFTAILTVETDKWGYDFCSGGERKRIDLSIMFALYDLYMSIYGQQCNIMILDEVDGRLDQKGVQAFSDVVNDMNTDNSERPRPDTVFVISHKSELRDVFPTQIIVKKESGFSRIDEQNFSN